MTVDTCDSLACVCVCVWWPHTSPDVWECIGFSWPVCERHCPLFLWFYLILSQACGLLSCEHTASIKDLFIALALGSFLHPDVKRVHSLGPAD